MRVSGPGGLGGWLAHNPRQSFRDIYGWLSRPYPRSTGVQVLTKAVHRLGVQLVAERVHRLGVQL